MNPNHSDILVIEDDKQIQIFLKYVLEKEHYVCQQAETGEQALTRLEDRPADVILLDLVCRILTEWISSQRSGPGGIPLRFW